VPSGRRAEKDNGKPEKSTGCFSPGSKYIKKTFRMKHIYLFRFQIVMIYIKYKIKAD